MDPSLALLKKKMPPPGDFKPNTVDWERLEAAVGLAYPQSFKEFVAVYGGSIWFDELSLFYDEATSDIAIKEFKNRLASKIKDMKHNTIDKNYDKISGNYYPDPGGLFPFMIDYSGNIYCWHTDHKDPDKWPITVWEKGPLRVFKNMTLAKMILDWLNGKPNMSKFWGKIKDWDPARIRLDPNA